jgi:hypothetical protein
MSALTTCPPRDTKTVPGEGIGFGVTVAVRQPAGDPGGWRISIFASFHARAFMVARTVLAAHVGDRPGDFVIFVGGAPGATGWSAMVEDIDPSVAKDATGAIQVLVQAHEIGVNPQLTIGLIP